MTVYKEWEDFTTRLSGIKEIQNLSGVYEIEIAILDSGVPEDKEYAYIQPKQPYNISQVVTGQLIFMRAKGLGRYEETGIEIGTQIINGGYSSDLELRVSELENKVQTLEASQDAMENRVEVLENTTASQGSRLSYVESVLGQETTLHTQLIMTPVSITTTEQSIVMSENKNIQGYKEDLTKFELTTGGSSFQLKGNNKYGYSPYIEVRNDSNNQITVQTQVIDSLGYVVASSSFVVSPRVNQNIPFIRTYTKYETLTNSEDRTFSIKFVANNTGTSITSGYLFLDS